MCAVYDVYDVYGAYGACSVYGLFSLYGMYIMCGVSHAGDAVRVFHSRLVKNFNANFVVETFCYIASENIQILCYIQSYLKNSMFSYLLRSNSHSSQ